MKLKFRQEALKFYNATPVYRTADEFCDFVDFIVCEAVLQERNRIVEILENERLIKTSNEGGVDFMIREAGNAIINNTILLITTESDIINKLNKK